MCYPKLIWWSKNGGWLTINSWIINFLSEFVWQKATLWRLNCARSRYWGNNVVVSWWCYNMEALSALVASLMNLDASLVTTSRMQQCINVLTDVSELFLFLFHSAISCFVQTSMSWKKFTSHASLVLSHDWKPKVFMILTLSSLAAQHPRLPYL